MVNLKSWFVIMANCFAMLMLVASCEKEDVIPGISNPDVTETPTAPGDDEKLNTDEFVRGDLKYWIDRENGECWVEGLAQSVVVNHISIPEIVTIDGIAYKVTRISDNAKISALSVETSSNIQYIGNEAFTSELEQLIVGSNVKEVSSTAWNTGNGPRETWSLWVDGHWMEYDMLSNFAEAKVSKIVWLPNTPPKGVTSNLAGKVNYVAEKYLALHPDYQVTVPELTSLFWVDGILYTLDKPAQRTCIAIGCDYNNDENIIFKPEVNNQGIALKVTEYGRYIFASNMNIKYVETGDVNKINEGTFMYCSNLQNIKLGTPIFEIEQNAFYGCSALLGLELGSRVSSIGKNALEGCYSLEKFIVQGKWTGLEMYLNLRNGEPVPIFHDCRNLKEIHLSRDVCCHNSHYYSHVNLFEGLPNLKTVKMTDGCTEVYKYEFKDCPNLTEVELGDNVLAIDRFAFSGCPAIKSFVVGKSIKIIEENAFSDCTGMRDFTSEAVIPPSCASQALQDIDKWKCKLHVPDESIELYKTADQWKDFLFIE